MIFLATLLAWASGIMLGLSIGYKRGLRDMRAEALKSSMDMVVKATIGRKHEPIDFNIDPCFVDDAPVEFLIERGQTREQFAEQVMHAVDEVRAEGHTTPATAMQSFASKIGVSINAAVALTEEEAERTLRERKEAYLKRAN